MLEDIYLEKVHGLDNYFNVRNDQNKTCKKQTIDDCGSCKEFENHFQVASEATKRNQEVKKRKWDDDDEMVVSVDMQKVNTLPRIPGLKVVALCKRIVLLNETSAPNQGCMKEWKEKATGVLWYEDIKGISVPDVVSTYIKFIRENHDIVNFIFWADICLGKIKNCYLYTVLANETNS